MERAPNLNFITAAERKEFENSHEAYELLLSAFWGKHIHLFARANSPIAENLPNDHIVVRFNNCLPIDNKSPRMDVLFFEGGENTKPEEMTTAPRIMDFVNVMQSGYRRLGYKVVKHRSPFRYYYSHESFPDESPFGFTHEWAASLYRKMGTKPLTGMLALEFFRQLPVRTINLHGFSFYRDEKKNFPAKIGAHEIAPQLKYLKSVFREDERLSADLITGSVIQDLGLVLRESEV